MILDNVMVMKKGTGYAKDMDLTPQVVLPAFWHRLFFFMMFLYVCLNRFDFFLILNTK